jgi:hypothetical protein
VAKPQPKKMRDDSTGELLGDIWQNAKVHSQLFEEDEGEDGLWGETDECRDVALEETEWAELRCVLDNVPDAVEFTGLGVHRACLEDVEWLGH